MSYVGIIAAGGEGRRTGLSGYTSKAALRLAGRSLLGHQVDFLRRSGVDRVIVICKPAHAKILGLILSAEERVLVSFVLSDCATGWAGEVERAAAHVGDEDEVLLISCDNYHTVGRAERLGAERDALFTFTAVPGTKKPTDGPVLGNRGGVWSQLPADFAGDIFTGYAVVRGRVLLDALCSLPMSDRGEKEFTALLEVLSQSPRCKAVAYGGEYLDVADLLGLARLDAALAHGVEGLVQVGAGVLLHDLKGRVFLTERQDGLGWVVPGGLVDQGEDYAHAASRELREEVGFDIPEADLRLLGVYPSIGKHGGPACSVIFHARVPEVVIRQWLLWRMDRREVKQVRWCSREDVEGLTIPFNLRGAVDDHFAGRELDVR